MKTKLLDLVLQRDDLAELEPAARRLELRKLVAGAVGDEDVGPEVRKLADRIDGWGPLSDLVRDPSISDILVNGPADVWVERAGSLQPSDVSFEDEETLRAFITRSLGSAGRRVDPSHPIADARMPDGSRVHVVLPPLTEAPLVSIRRFGKDVLRLDDLVALEALDEEDAHRLARVVTGRGSIVVSGATGTGKTTLLNALIAEVPVRERVLVLEETPELRPCCDHFVRLWTRDPNLEGVGGVDLATLARASLRMRPDRIVIGEVRGREAGVALSAMRSGHEGSMLTVHAASAPAAIDRLAELSSEGHPSGDEPRARSLVERAVDVVVHLRRDDQGIRRVAEIIELS